MEENTIVYPEPPYRVSGSENNIYIPEIEGVEYIAPEYGSGTILPDSSNGIAIGFSWDRPREQPLPTRGLTIKAVPKEGYKFEEWDETEWFFENTMFFLEPIRSRFNRNLIHIPEAKSPVWGYFLVINYDGNNEDAEDYSGMSYLIQPEEEVYIYAPDNTDGVHETLDEWYFEYIPNLIEAFPETPHQEGNTVFIPEVEGVRYIDSFSGDDVSGEIEIEEEIGDLNIYALPENGYFFEEDDFGYDWYYFYEYSIGALAPYRSDDNPNIIIIPDAEPPVSRYVNAMTGETAVGSVPIDNLQFGYIEIYAEDMDGYWLEEWEFLFENILILPVEPARFENTVTIPEVDGITYYRDWVEEITGTLEIPKDDFLYIGAEVDWQNGYDWDWDNMGDMETEWYFDYDPAFDEEDPEPIEVTPAPPVFTDDFENGGGTFTTVYTEGVIYAPAEGTAEPGETIVITATPEDGYTLVGTTEWSHVFPEKPDPEPPVQRAILVLEQEIIKYLRTQGFNASHASPVSPNEITDDYIVVNRISGGETWVQARWTTATIYIDCHIENPEVTGRDRYDAARLAYKVVESLKSFMKEKTWARKIEGVSVTDSSFGDYTYYTVSATLSHNYL